MTFLFSVPTSGTFLHEYLTKFLLYHFWFGDVGLYLIQKHYARHLHYDLRLEMNGILKSWALPKHPPSKTGVKRLAIQTENHEMEYAKFEGEIPEGVYGAGIVEIWDEGTYEMEEKEKDKFVFNIEGKKLEGRYCLMKFKKDKWLFFRC